jgi:hypothetical protein
MLDGEISKNTSENFGISGCGMYNMGTFELYSGQVSDNILQ